MTGMKVLIRKEEDGVFRAYRAIDQAALYLGGPTAEDCRQRVLDYHPTAEIEFPEPHEHHPATVHSAQPPPGLRRTGIYQIETCRCGLKRHVWLTSFKVDAGAWQ